MFVHTTLVPILCAGLVLTSSVSKNSTDGFSKDSRDAVRAKNFRDTGDLSSTPIAPSTTDKNSKKESVLSIMAEGGPIYQSRNTETSSHVAPNVSKIVIPMKSILEISDKSAIKDSAKLPKTRNASVVPRKEAMPSSKITARKGVGPESSVITESSIDSIDEAVSRVLPYEKDTSHKKIEPISVKIANDTKQEKTTKKSSFKQSNVNASANITISNSSDVSLTEKKLTMSQIMKKIIFTSTIKDVDISSTSSSPMMKKFKPKPTVTIGEMDIDKPIPASPTKTPPLGMPRKIDYIVPVIITIMALPLLGGTAFFLYRRGRDCWDKRHYRRMDFLIDGMYNDYSWK